MIKRIRKIEEERKMEYVKACAVEVVPEVASSYVKMASKMAKIPSHLKRVRKIDGKIYVITQLCEQKLDLKDIVDREKVIVVEVPKFAPITREQYEEAKAAWPCYFYPLKEEKLKESELFTEYFERLLVSDKSEFSGCAGMCIIVDPSTGAIRSECRDDNDILEHGIFKAIEEVSKSKIGYLCTGLDAYILNEPCIACSFAFVHSRIRRVFYIFNSNIGPFSKLKINTNGSLNHRYLAYKLDYEKYVGTAYGQ
jgi:tRNA-specific adenosine deaminase 3